MEAWNRETVPKVMKIVSTRLPQRDLISLLLVSPSIYRNLISHPSLWLVIFYGLFLFIFVLDFHEMSKAGDRLIAALSLPRYHNVNHINLEFSHDLEDKHLEIVKNECGRSTGNLEVLNLNGCQKISDVGIDFITYNCPKLKVFSIYWNIRVSDVGVKNLVKNCKLVIDLNLSGCKNLSDEGLSQIAKCKNLNSLNLTWCVRISDQGVIAIAQGCRSLEFLRHEWALLDIRWATLNNGKRSVHGWLLKLRVLLGNKFRSLATLVYPNLAAAWAAELESLGRERVEPLCSVFMEL
ncbi:hypothetical protein RD792_000316 [Penstemon davidsonii]|uniref:F-box/LRR-repeat protein 15-like leucin rich repeat domain-containing protein n=1 Tax=Penstemon davidsonii TaxID=160366 RepID=A0ABR0DLM4_9LAMI|nr:hypothetical protein RD792_000316 [Penstemon davidsonii]